MREFSIITSNNHPSNPQQPPATHPLRLAPVRWIWIASGKRLHNGKIHHAFLWGFIHYFDWAMASRQQTVDITRPGSLWQTPQQLDSWGSTMFFSVETQLKKARFIAGSMWIYWRLCGYRFNIDMNGGLLKWGTAIFFQNEIILVLEPMVWGYQHFRKPPYQWMSVNSYPFEISIGSLDDNGQSWTMRMEIIVLNG